MAAPEDDPVRVRAVGATALSWRGRCPGALAPAAAAVATALRRAAAEWYGEFPTGACGRLLPVCVSFPAVAAYAVTRRLARGVLGAPLKKIVEKFSQPRGHRGQ